MTSYPVLAHFWNSPCGRQGEGGCELVFLIGSARARRPGKGVNDSGKSRNAVVPLRCDGFRSVGDLLARTLGF